MYKILVKDIDCTPFYLSDKIQAKDIDCTTFNLSDSLI